MPHPPGPYYNIIVPNPGKKDIYSIDIK
jgi:hypothetical protein